MEFELRGGVKCAAALVTLVFFQVLYQLDCHRSSIKLKSQTITLVRVKKNHDIISTMSQSMPSLVYRLHVVSYEHPDRV